MDGVLQLDVGALDYHSTTDAAHARFLMWNPARTRVTVGFNRSALPHNYRVKKERILLEIFESGVLQASVYCFQGAVVPCVINLDADQAVIVIAKRV